MRRWRGPRRSSASPASCRSSRASSTSSPTSCGCRGCRNRRRSRPAAISTRVGCYTERVSGLDEQLLDRVPVGIIAYRLDDLADDRSLRLIYANATAGKLLGLDFAPMIGRRLVDITPGVPEGRLRSYARACREQLTLDMGTINYADPKVAPATLTLALTAVSLADQSCAVYFENLTVQRMDARLNAQVTRFLDSIVESIPAMVFVKHASDLRFARFNQAGEELLGVKREALLGKNDYDF